MGNGLRGGVGIGAAEGRVSIAMRARAARFVVYNASVGFFIKESTWKRLVYSALPLEDGFHGRDCRTENLESHSGRREADGAVENPGEDRGSQSFDMELQKDQHSDVGGASSTGKDGKRQEHAGGFGQGEAAGRGEGFWVSQNEERGELLVNIPAAIVQFCADPKGISLIFSRETWEGIREACGVRGACHV